MTAFPPSDKGSGYWFFALAELLAFSGEKNVAADAKVTAQDSVENPPQWSKASLGRWGVQPFEANGSERRACSLSGYVEVPAYLQPALGVGS